MKIISTKINKLDLQEALKIYNHFILNSFSNFEEKKISINKFELLYKKIKINKLPFIIAKIENQVIGVALSIDLEKRVATGLLSNTQFTLIQTTLIKGMAQES